MIEETAASAGVAIGKVFLLKNNFERQDSGAFMGERKEYNRFTEAIFVAEKQLIEIQKKALHKISAKELEVFDAHIMMLQDEKLHTDVLARIKNGLCAEHAVDEVFEEYCIAFKSIDDDYLRERIQDFRDVQKRILRCLAKNFCDPLSNIESESILVSVDLTPSETAQINRDKVRGFVTETGSETSHVAILARTMGIPAIVGASGVTNHVREGDTIAIDGCTGKIYVNPDKPTLVSLQVKAKQDVARKQELLRLRDLPAKTCDGTRTIELCANIGKPADCKFALENGAAGCFRRKSCCNILEQMI